MTAANKTQKPDLDDTPKVQRTKRGKIVVNSGAARPRLSRAGLRIVVAGLLFALAGGMTTWLYFWQYRADEQTDPGTEATVISAARDGTVAILSYSPKTLDKDFATAKSHLTGDFKTYYDQFTQQIVTPAAKDKALTTTAQVMGAAVSEMNPGSAVVLVFVNQSTTSKDRPDPSMAASSVVVSMNKVDGQWLITKFEPV